MTRHSDDGAAVAPVPLTDALLRIRALRPLTLGALIAGPAALAMVMVTGLLSVELGGADEHGMLLRASVVTAGVLAVVGALAHPLWVVAARHRLLAAAAIGADRVRPTPPATERRELAIGPQPVLARVGAWAAMMALPLLVLAIIAARSDELPIGIRIAAVPVSVSILLAGSVVAVRQRRGGASRARWERLESRAALRWATSVTPVERVPVPGARPGWPWVVTPVAVGGVALLLGIWMRQPGEGADPVAWSPLGEITIDVLVVTGGGLIVLGAIAAAVTSLVQLRRRIRSDGDAARAARAGEMPAPAAVDAIALDGAPIERVAVAVAVLGWFLVAAGLVPAVAGALPVLDQTAQPIPFLPWVFLLLPAAAGLVAAAWLGSLGARRAHELRTAVLAAARRDPVPWVRSFDRFDRPEELWGLAPGVSGHWGIGAAG